MKKVVIAGGTGFIGQYFQKKFADLGYEVIIISRKKPHVTWEEPDEIKDAIENAEMLINLAGKSVNCRYHAKNRETILNSRVETTEILGEAIIECHSPPELWINSSTATIYRHAEDRPMTEETGEIGSGFSVNVAKNWEEVFFNFTLPKTRQIALRTAIVLGSGGGVMTPYKNLVKLGLGGIHGPGTQMFSWIHIEDLFNIVLFLRDNNDLSGVFNCSSPNPVTNRELMRTLRKKLNKNVGLPAPRWMLEIGTFFLRTETELVLKSRWVVPDRLERVGYTFTFPALDRALEESLS
ncbi:TIGR01777 family oxidoreductase [Pseudalkalibacillus berkeleyi]|uniref:TIGR01777 family oxidoreductase n=1 Tax=Pseudalkalibacillus berkeleyi TaxID=1069813 RepID=A0ABS9GX97_9BACL|nr:TIGR01777 family oxidoreductase [Pseudalkalibacillus berkeleyi]MCF6136305.1 TIGR01777 family oxidoreductase [Pseudalkalibacillus berkeleyi]